MHDKKAAEPVRSVTQWMLLCTRGEKLRYTFYVDFSGRVYGIAPLEFCSESVARYSRRQKQFGITLQMSIKTEM